MKLFNRQQSIKEYTKAIPFWNWLKFSPRANLNILLDNCQVDVRRIFCAYGRIIHPGNFLSFCVRTYFSCLVSLIKCFTLLCDAILAKVVVFISILVFTNTNAQNELKKLKLHNYRNKDRKWLIKVNKFQCWSMDIDFQINWRFEVNKPHKTKNRIFHWIREELLQTVSPEVSVMNWSYSKQWIRFQWRTGRDKILLTSTSRPFWNMKKKFSDAWLDVSVSETTQDFRKRLHVRSWSLLFFRYPFLLLNS